MDKYKYVLWDWNGTLLDDLMLNYNLGNYLLEERGLPELKSMDFYLENFGFPIINFYKLVGFDFEKEDYRSLADEYLALYEKRQLTEAKLFGDAVSTIDKLNSAGIKQAIISATEHNTLLGQVERFGIANKFVKILGTENNFGASKVGSALAWFEINGIDPKRAVFVGDTTHDFETAQAIGCDCMLVARGHNSKRRLLQTGCRVFSSLDELVNS